MRFCPKCRQILVLKKGKLMCSCGYCESPQPFFLKEKIDHKDIVVVDEENEHIGDAVMDMACWNCGHVGVYFWMVQMRRADEPPIRFYKCRKCKKVWRSGK